MSTLHTHISGLNIWRSVCDIGGSTKPLHAFSNGVPSLVKSGDFVWANNQWNMLCPISMSWVITDIDDDLDSSDGEIQRNRHRNLILSRALIKDEQISLVFNWELIGGMSPINTISEATIDISSGVTTGNIEKNGNFLSKLQFKNGTISGQMTLNLTKSMQQYRLCTRAFYTDPSGSALGEVQVNLTLVSATGVLVGVDGSVNVEEFISNNDF